MADRATRWVTSVDELVQPVRDGARIGVSGYHFVRAPMAQLRAVIRRGVRGLRYVAWGGGLPLELLLAADAVSSIDVCFSSLDVFGLAPRFRRSAESGRIRVRDWTALALISGLAAHGQRVPFQVFQSPIGSSLAGEYDEEPLPDVGLSRAPAVSLDVFLLHAQRADDEGNVEIDGSRGFDVLCAMAAARTIVSVEERVPRGSLNGARSFVLPRAFVDRIVVAPMGAHPTACLPYYIADPWTIADVAELSTDASPEEVLRRVSPERLEVLRRIAGLPGDIVRESISSAAPAEVGPGDEPDLMVAELARDLDDGSVCSVGSVSPLATTAYLVAKRTHPKLTILASNAQYIDVIARPMSLLAGEMLDFHSAATVCSGEDSYHWYYQQGRVTHETISPAQVDRAGRINNIAVQAENGRWIRLPGQGGMADVANLHRNLSLYVTRHSRRTLVERVDVVAASRVGLQVRRRGREPAGRVTLITNQARFELDPRSRQLVMTGLHPGRTLAQVQAITGFPVVVRGAAVTALPTAAERDTIRSVDPLGIRILEFVPAKERLEIIRSILDREAALLGMG